MPSSRRIFTSGGGSGSRNLNSSMDMDTSGDDVASTAPPKSLLEPLRALADNWDVDIARDLEAYADRLARVTFTFSGDKSARLNFAEAALVIQGSACVYSRKVEYLHALVYHALGLVTGDDFQEGSEMSQSQSQSQSQAQDGRRGKRGQRSVCALHFEELPFLPLDDDGSAVAQLGGVMDEAVGIDLDDICDGVIDEPEEDGENGALGDGGFSSRPHGSRHAGNLGDELRGAMGLSRNLGLGPLGGGLGAAEGGLAGIGGAGAGAGFGVGVGGAGAGTGGVSYEEAVVRGSLGLALARNSHPHRVPGSTHDAFRDDLEIEAGRRAADPHAMVAGGAAAAAAAALAGTAGPDGPMGLASGHVHKSGALLVGADADAAAAVADSAADTFFGGEDLLDTGLGLGLGSGDADDDDVGHGFDTFDVPDVEDFGGPESRADPATPVGKARGRGLAAAGVFAAAFDGAQGVGTGADPAARDPWAVLDPHDTGDIKPRPYRRGRAHVIPRPSVFANSVFGGDSAATAGAGAEIGPVPSLASVLSRTGPGSASSSFKATVFADLGYASRGEARRRAAIRASETARAARKNVESRAGALDDDADHDHDAFGIDLGGMDDFGGAGLDDGDDDHPGDADPSGRVSDLLGTWSGADAGATSALGAIANESGRASTLSSGNVPVRLSIGTETTTYEDLCRAHMESYMSGFRRYAEETALSQRVRTWETSLGPRLDKEAGRSAFDIDDYGDRVVHAVEAESSKAGDAVAFSRVASTSEATDVPRMFLAMLELANRGTVEVVRPVEDPSIPDGEFALRVLNDDLKGSNVDIEALSVSKAV